MGAQAGGDLGPRAYGEVYVEHGDVDGIGVSMKELHRFVSVSGDEHIVTRLFEDARYRASERVVLGDEYGQLVVGARRSSACTAASPSVTGRYIETVVPFPG